MRKKKEKGKGAGGKRPLLGRRSPDPFECTECGDCCRRFEVVIDPWVEEGIVHMVRDGSIGVEVWPWEARELITSSMAGDLGLVLLPSNIIVDSMRKRAVALSYFIANEDCPFQEGKLCTIYTKRPNVCRYFPLVLAKSGVRITERCPEAARPRMGTDATANAEALRKAYDEAVTCILRDIFYHEHMVNLLGELELTGEVAWDWSPDPGEVLRMVQDQEWMDLLEFIVDTGMMSAGEVEEMVTRWLLAEGIEDKVDIKLLTL